MARQVGGLALPALERMGLGRIGTISGGDPKNPVRGAHGVMI